MTLEEALALAVLKGDAVAANALADKLIEARNGPVDEGYRQSHKAGHPDGYTVYHWPEFIAFARRLGVLVNLATVELVITIPVDGAVGIAQKYLGKEPT